MSERKLRIGIRNEPTSDTAANIAHHLALERIRRFLFVPLREVVFVVPNRRVDGITIGRSDHG